MTASRTWGSDKLGNIKKAEGRYLPWGHLEGPAAPKPRWRAFLAVQLWGQGHSCPALVVVGDGDQRAQDYNLWHFFINEHATLHQLHSVHAQLDWGWHVIPHCWQFPQIFAEPRAFREGANVIACGLEDCLEVHAELLPQDDPSPMSGQYWDCPLGSLFTSSGLLLCTPPLPLLTFFFFSCFSSSLAMTPLRPPTWPTVSHGWSGCPLISFLRMVLQSSQVSFWYPVSRMSQVIASWEMWFALSATTQMTSWMSVSWWNVLSNDQAHQLCLDHLDPLMSCCWPSCMS